MRPSAGAPSGGTYVDAIRDWVAKGEASEYVLSAEEVRQAD